VRVETCTDVSLLQSSCMAPFKLRNKSFHKLHSHTMCTILTHNSYKVTISDDICNCSIKVDEVFWWELVLFENCLNQISSISVKQVSPPFITNKAFEFLSFIPTLVKIDCISCIITMISSRLVNKSVCLFIYLLVTEWKHFVRYICKRL